MLRSRLSRPGRRVSGEVVHERFSLHLHSRRLRLFQCRQTCAVLRYELGGVSVVFLRGIGRMYHHLF